MDCAAMARESLLPTRPLLQNHPTTRCVPAAALPRYSADRAHGSDGDSPHRPFHDLPPQSIPVSSPFVSPKYRSSLQPCCGPDGYLRSSHGPSENHLDPAPALPSTACSRASCPARTLVLLAGWLRLALRRKSKSNRIGTASHP